jgi:hypothetical protein
MVRAAKNHSHIYRMYNFDWDPEPGSVEHMINQRIKRGAELQGRKFLRMAESLEAIEAEQAAAAAAGGAQPVADVAEAGPSSSHRVQQQQQQGAATVVPPFGSMTMNSGTSGVWGAGPLTGSSLSQGVGRASKAVLGTLARAAKRAPTWNVGRPRLSRPGSAGSSSSNNLKRQQQQQHGHQAI